MLSRVISESMLTCLVSLGQLYALFKQATAASSFTEDPKLGTFDFKVCQMSSPCLAMQCARLLLVESEN